MSYYVGGTQQFAHTDRDADGNILSPSSGTWLAADPSIVEISSSGLAEWLAAGVTTLYFTKADGSRVGSLIVVVLAAPPTTLVASPSSVTIPVNGAVTIAVTGTDALSHSVSDLELTSVASDHANIATVARVEGAELLIVGAAAGSCTVTIASGGATTTVAVTVVAVADIAAAVAAEATARTAAISAAVSALVASAPGTLDTLNELATALGDDPNLATTLAASIAAKLPLAGGALTGPVTLALASVSALVANVVGLSSAVTWNPPAANAGGAYGALFIGYADGPNQMAAVEGVSCQAAVASTRTGPTPFLKGLRTVAQKAFGAFNVTGIYGIDSWADHHIGTAAVQAAYSALYSVQGTGIATLLAGLWVQRPTVSVSAAATALYGIRIEDALAQVGTVGAYWGVYVAGAAPNFFGGDVQAASFHGDGTTLTGIATAASLTTEATARTAADTALQANIDAEAAARVAADAAEATARTSAISAAIASLINSAPGALDTLKELADAMGDDANFAATMTTALAGKAAAATTIAGYGITDLNSLGDARWLKQAGGSIYNGVNSGTTIALNIGSSSVAQNALKVWGTAYFGNNNDAIFNSTGSGFMHMGSYQGVSLGLNNGTVQLKTLAATITAPSAAFVQTTGGAPASSSAAGVAGQMAWDSSYEYRCVAANTWMRTAHSTF